MASEQFQIMIDKPFSGYAPAYYTNTYPSYGNSNMAGRMTDIDITDPNILSQGLGLISLTNGTQAGVVTTLIKHVLDTPVSSGITYGGGGAKLYKISSTTVVSGGTPSWPRTIDKAAVTGEDIESVIKYGANLYYFYNHSGAAGDIGIYDLSTTFDDDWGSTVPTGAQALNNAPHPSMVGGDDILYFGNGRYVGNYDGTTLDTQALDLPVNSVVVDLAYFASRVIIAVNTPNLVSNSNIAEIYVWDGVSTSWDDTPHVRINGRIGAIREKNGIIYIFYIQNGDDSYKIGVLNGNSIQTLVAFSGSLPLFYQVNTYKDFLIFVSNGQILAYGTRDETFKKYLFQYFDGGYSTVGSLSVPFGTPYITSTDGATNFKIDYATGRSVLSDWKSLDIPVSTDGGRGIIDKLIVQYEATATGARVDIKINANRGTTTTLGNISHINDSSYLKKVFDDINIECETFRLELDWTNGSATNPLNIRSVQIIGHTINEQ